MNKEITYTIVEIDGKRFTIPELIVEYRFVKAKLEERLLDEQRNRDINSQWGPDCAT